MMIASKTKNNYKISLHQMNDIFKTKYIKLTINNKFYDYKFFKTLTDAKNIIREFKKIGA